MQLLNKRRNGAIESWSLPIIIIIIIIIVIITYPSLLMIFVQSSNFSIPFSLSLSLSLSVSVHGHEEHVFVITKGHRCYRIRASISSSFISPSSAGCTLAFVSCTVAAGDSVDDARGARIHIRTVKR